jgi:hypothetical protein
MSPTDVAIFDRSFILPPFTFLDFFFVLMVPIISYGNCFATLCCSKSFRFGDCAVFFVAIRTPQSAPGPTFVELNGHIDVVRLAVGQI